MEQSVLKRRHIKFRRREITQKKVYNMSIIVYFRKKFLFSNSRVTTTFLLIQVFDRLHPIIQQIFNEILWQLPSNKNSPVTFTLKLMRWWWWEIRRLPVYDNVEGRRLLRQTEERSTVEGRRYGLLFWASIVSWRQMYSESKCLLKRSSHAQQLDMWQICSWRRIFIKCFRTTCS